MPLVVTDKALHQIAVTVAHRAVVAAIRARASRQAYATWHAVQCKQTAKLNKLRVFWE